MTELYDAYVERRKLYQSDASIEHKETMLDALKKAYGGNIGLVYADMG